MARNKDMEQKPYMTPAAASTIKQGRVSQSTIDKIKKMGMTAAINEAKTNRLASPEFQKGVRRMYGDRYFQNPTYKPNGVVFTGPSKYAAPSTAPATKRVKDTSDKSAASKPAVSSDSKRQTELKKAKNFWSGVAKSFGQAYLGK